jgi:thiol-disulfide isomerase/thioredoxin
MVRRVSLVALVALASTAAAQTSPPPVSPVIACQQQGQAEQTRLLKLARDSGKAPDVTAIVNANKAITRECASKIDAASGSAKDRVDLANLYLGTNDTTKAESIINGMLKAKGTEADRAEALRGGVRLAIAKWDPFAGINQQAEAYLRELDALSDAVLPAKVAAHTQLLGRYDYADNDDGLNAQAKILLVLARRAIETNAMPMASAHPAQGEYPAQPAYNTAYLPMVNAYRSLARAAGDYLHADSALLILDEAERVIGPGWAQGAASVADSRAMYELVGKSATPIDGKWWINAADGSVIKPGSGKVSVVQFTAHWCVPCKKSYPPMNRLMEQYKGKPVESIMATSLYGYIGTQRNLTPEQEVAADREYYSVEHKLSSVVAINPSVDFRSPEFKSSNDGRYAVGGIPEIVIIDKKGVIRATVVGWDRGNEARFAALIDKLLAEK